MNKYSYLNSIRPDAVMGGQGAISQIYPETKGEFALWEKSKSSCGACKQKTHSRAILMIILETPKGDRDVSGLKRALPADFVNLL